MSQEDRQLWLAELLEKPHLTADRRGPAEAGGVVLIQRRRHSLLESLVNVAIGYLVAVGSQIAIFPFFDIHIPLGDNFLIGLWFTVISIARSYAVRRWFTHRTERQRELF